MKLVHIKAISNGSLFASYLYLADSHTEAILKHKRYFPEQSECTLIANTIDSNDSKNSELIKATAAAGNLF